MTSQSHTRSDPSCALPGCTAMNAGVSHNVPSGNSATAASATSFGSSQ
jgi:hypothetical protein